MKLLVVIVASAVALAISAGFAAARSRVETVNINERATASRLTLGGSEIDIICNVTLSGTMQRLIPKIRGAEAGSDTADTVNTCDTADTVNTCSSTSARQREQTF
jgi:hypothetical protein